MNSERDFSIIKKDNLKKSKKILCKLINHYTYEYIIEYLFNTHQNNNPKLETIFKMIIIICKQKLKHTSYAMIIYYYKSDKKVKKNNQYKFKR